MINARIHDNRHGSDGGNDAGWWWRRRCRRRRRSGRGSEPNVFPDYDRYRTGSGAERSTDGQRRWLLDQHGLDSVDRRICVYDDPDHSRLSANPLPAARRLVCHSGSGSFATRVRQVVTSGRLDRRDGHAGVIDPENVVDTRDSFRCNDPVRKAVSVGAGHRKSNLVIFVTPTIIDPAGNKVHTPSEMPFAQGAKSQPLLRSER